MKKKKKAKIQTQYLSQQQSEKFIIEKIESKIKTTPFYFSSGESCNIVRINVNMRSQSRCGNF